LIVPDQTRALIKCPDRYDPEPNRTYEEFATHYGCALLAARPAHQRDKPKVEGAVLLVEQWILSRLRNRQFFSLGELDGAVAELIIELKQLPFKKLPGCRKSAFDELDAPALKALPSTRYEISRWKSAIVNIDHHVDFDAHYYSVPHALVRMSVELRVTDNLVECFQANQRVACHALSHKRGHHTTNAEHTPTSHRAHLQWTPQKLIDWGLRIGVSTAAVVTWQLENRPHPEQGYRARLGLQRLARQFTPARLEAACTRALAIHSLTFRSVDSILKKGLDRQLSLLPAKTTALTDHEEVRGPDYFH
jgi:transposase